MQKLLRRACLLGILGGLAWVVTMAGAQTAPPPAAALPVTHNFYFRAS